MPTVMINKEVPEVIMDALETTADTLGAAYALPPMKSDERTITWQASYEEAPGAIDLDLEGAIDEDGPYATLDTTTATGGEIRIVTTASGMRYVRAHQNSRTGAGAFVTVKVNVS